MLFCTFLLEIVIINILMHSFFLKPDTYLSKILPGVILCVQSMFSYFHFCHSYKFISLHKLNSLLASNVSKRTSSKIPTGPFAL